MFNTDPSMMLVKTLQSDRERKFPKRHWTEARSSRKSRRS
jgi:hypothetical protein